MTEHNHHRGTRRILPRHLAAERADFAARSERPELIWRPGPLATRRVYHARAQLADVAVGAGVYGYVYDGHRGLAKAKRGAKKFVRSRTRFHDEAETRRLAAEADHGVGEAGRADRSEARV